MTMLHIVTVHWQSTRWIVPQSEYLARHLGGPYRVYASLNGIEDDEVRDGFHLAVELEGTHAEKLNELAKLVIDVSSPDDRLLFLDGDAFPVRPIAGWCDELLAAYPLAAVRRDENLGDRQPHPCFTLTTCGFWNDLGGDWREGGTWVNSAGDPTTDVGGTLLHQLATAGIEWLPILRTNTSNPDPLLFGVYGHRIYHHGAGFRPPVSRLSHQADRKDAEATAAFARGTSLEGLARRTVQHPSQLRSVRPSDARRLGHAVQVSIGKRRRKRIERAQARRMAKSEARQQAVYDALLANPDFFTEFDRTTP